MKHVVWGVVLNGTRGSPVEKVGGGMKCFNPKRRGKIGLDKETAHIVVGGPNKALGFSVLGGSVGARETIDNAIRREESA